jgi:hypothetical protein
MRAIVLAAVAACAPVALGRADPNPDTKTPAPSASAQSWVQSQLSSWPEASRTLAAQLVSHYGRPSETTAERLTWYDNAPWRRTTLYKAGPLHNFPAAHHDILEQTVAYRVPPDKIGDLVAYDGSLVVDRTRGELSVHCDSEQANILTLNIANDILTGERSVDQALGYHAQVIRGLQIGEPEAYSQKLRFAPTANAADPGEEAELLRHLEH